MYLESKKTLITNKSGRNKTVHVDKSFSLAYIWQTEVWVYIEILQIAHHKIYFFYF